MKKNYSIIILFFILSYSCVYADGLLLPSNKNYPKDFLRNKLTHVTVNINGAVSETTVYQEFENEWTDSTDAVYSFPLPANARATKIIYWYNDKSYEAVLKVKEQSTNPGTGEGGIAALVNEYIGKNGIKIELRNIKAGTIQKIELHYIQLCEYYKGRYYYSFPLNTSDFVTHPLDLLQFDINVNSNSKITGYNVPTETGISIKNSSDNNLNLQVIESKAYINHDFEFYFDTDNSDLGIDFYSTASDTMNGHFALFVKPQNEAPSDSILPKRIIFMLSNSNNMTGNKLTQSIFSISKAIDELKQDDLFNIIVFNYSVSTWQSLPVSATSDNIQSAKDYLGTVTSSWGSDMGTAIKSALTEITDNTRNNAIIVFSDGVSSNDPKEIASSNTFKTGIFPIAIGDNPSRERLEMTAALNYGFVTYLDPLDDLSTKISRIIEQVSNPILKDVAFEFGAAQTSDIIPEKIPSTYAGSLFFMTGRYANSGQSALSIAGTANKKVKAYDFHLNFSDSTGTYPFTRTLWAKESIDDIEREIAIYGETTELKNKAIELSLAYGVRCKYTAYIADYQNETSAVDDEKNNLIIPRSYISGNYPNPFNPSTTIRIYLNKSSEGKVKLLRIYNIIGQLVAVIDLTDLSEGWNNIVFNGKDSFGNSLPSGIYIAQLIVGNNVTNSIKLTLLK